MQSSDRRDLRPLGLAGTLILLACVAVAYGSQFWPTPLVRTFMLHWLGDPPREGFAGMFLPHALLYTTLPALVCALLWLILVKLRFIPSFALGNLKRSMMLGVPGGLIAIIAVLPLAWLALPAGSVHWIPPNWSSIAGNVFSNFYEEFIFRGFLLVALRRAVGFWPAAIISSLLWGLSHTQYPLLLQLSIVATGIWFSWLARQVQSLSAPYIAHMVADVIGDSLVG